MQLLFDDGITWYFQDVNITFWNMIHFYMTQKKTQNLLILLLSIPNVRKKEQIRVLRAISMYY